MEYSKRTREILLQLLNEDGIREQEIADRVGVSKRTVQRELDSLENSIAPSGLSLLRKKGEGVRLAGPEECKEELRALLSAPAYDDYTDKRNRKTFLLYELLRDPAPHKLYGFSSKMGISEATVASDLDELRPWLQKSRLNLIKRQGYGVELSGTEADYRSAVRRFVTEHSDWGRIGKAGYREDALTGAILNLLEAEPWQLIGHEEMGRILRLLFSLEEPELRTLDNDSLINLAVYMAIAVREIRNGRTVEDLTPEQEASLPDQNGILMARRLAKALEQEYTLSFSGAELCELALNIQSARKMYYGSLEEQIPGLDDQVLRRIVDRMIDRFDPDYAYDLKCDEAFVRGLIVHLKPALIRLKNGRSIYNPLLPQVKAEYPQIFERMQNAIGVIPEETGLTPTEEETGFLTVHFGAALLRARNTRAYSRKVTIGVVCASGFGVSRLMLSKLQEHVGTHARLQAYSFDDLHGPLLQETDFFVSTIGLDALGVDAIVVNPLIGDDDLAQINVKLDEYRHIRKEEPQPEFLSFLDQAQCTAGDIRFVLSHYRLYRIAPDIGLDELLVFLAGEATADPQKREELRAKLKAREALDSQIFPDLGFALIHTRTNAVTEPVFWTAVPDGTGSFTGSSLNGIRTVLYMLAPDDDRARIHAAVLGALSSAMVEDDAFSAAVLAGDEPALRTGLARVLQHYFNKSIQHDNT